MDRTPFIQEPLPPPDSTPIAFQHINENSPYPVNNAPLHPTPQVYNGGVPPQQYQPAPPPPPLNAHNAPTAVQTPCTSPRIAKLNATPQSQPFKRIECANRKHGCIAFAIIVVTVIVLLILFFTIFFTKTSRELDKAPPFTKVLGEMDEARKSYEKFTKNHFPDSWDSGSLKSYGKFTKNDFPDSWDSGSDEPYVRKHLPDSWYSGSGTIEV